MERRRSCVSSSPVSDRCTQVILRDTSFIEHQRAVRLRTGAESRTPMDKVSHPK